MMDHCGKGRVKLSLSINHLHCVKSLTIIYVYPELNKEQMTSGYFGKDSYGECAIVKQSAIKQTHPTGSTPPK